MDNTTINHDVEKDMWSDKISHEDTLFGKMLADYREMGAYAIEVSLIDGTKFKLLLEDLYIYLGSHVYIPGFAVETKQTQEGKLYYYKPDRYYYYNQAKEKKVMPENNFIDIILEEIKDFKTGRDFKSSYAFPSNKEIYSFMITNFYPNKDKIYKKWNKATYKVINNFVMANIAVFDINGEDNYTDYDISIDAKVPVKDFERNFCFNLNCIASVKPFSDQMIDVRRIMDKDFMEAVREFELSRQ